jgi:hypothetical protein
VRAFIIVDLLASSSEISTKGHVGISQSLRKAQRDTNFARPNVYEPAGELTGVLVRIKDAEFRCPRLVRYALNTHRDSGHPESAASGYERPLRPYNQ